MSDLSPLPQGYEPHEIPADYDGPLYMEGQVRAAIESAVTVEREACARACEQLSGSKWVTLEASAECALAIRARGENGPEFWTFVQC